MAIGGVLTHLGAQLGDVATTFADDGPGNLGAKTGKRIKKIKFNFLEKREPYLPCCKRVDEVPCRPWGGGVWPPALSHRQNYASYLWKNSNKKMKTHFKREGGLEI